MGLFRRRQKMLNKESILCYKCGEINSVNYNWCIKCGTDLRSTYPKVVNTAVPFNPEFDPNNQHSLRDWWHQILRTYGKYPSYAFFLCLPSDIEAIKYLTNYGKELDILSRSNCLVISLSQNQFRPSGYDEKVWNLSINEQIAEGYSSKIAQLFKINYTDFPCIILFDDVRSSKKMIYTFKRLQSSEISEQMRLIFSIIQKSVDKKQKVLKLLEQERYSEQLHKVRQNLFTRLFNFAGKSFEAAMEAWIGIALK